MGWGWLSYPWSAFPTNGHVLHFAVHSWLESHSMRTASRVILSELIDWLAVLASLRLRPHVAESRALFGSYSSVSCVGEGIRGICIEVLIQLVSHPRNQELPCNSLAIVVVCPPSVVSYSVQLLHARPRERIVLVHMLLLAACFHTSNCVTSFAA